jgi:hypothetical protein
MTKSYQNHLAVFIDNLAFFQVAPDTLHEFFWYCEGVFPNCILKHLLK